MMNDNGQRRKKKYTKSRLPIPTKTTTNTITTAHPHITMSTTVTPAKLENKKNNNKSNLLFSTTCSRMAQELKNYNNKKPVNSNRRLSSTSSFFHVNDSKKMNREPTKTLTMNKKGKLTPNKNVGATTTTAIPAIRRKSPITQLQEDLENLRRKNAEDKSLVKRQKDEIENLKKLLAASMESNNISANKRIQKIGTTGQPDNNKLQIELEQQLSEKQKLRKQLDSITKETEELNASAVDQLEVTSITGDALFSKQIMELQKQLEIKEADFKKQLAKHQKLIHEKDHTIQQQKVTIDQQKAGHANQIAQLNSIHMQAINKLQIEHERNMIYLNQKHNDNNQQKKKMILDMDTALEQVLVEFEQNQHKHAPPRPLTYQEPHHKLATPLRRHINQQWYTQQYMPIDALSWPSPQPLPNLKRQLQTR